MCDESIDELLKSMDGVLSVWTWTRRNRDYDYEVRVTDPPDLFWRIIEDRGYYVLKSESDLPLLSREKTKYYLAERGDGDD